MQKHKDNYKTHNSIRRFFEERIWLPGNKRSSEILGLYLTGSNKVIFQDKYNKLWTDFF